MDFGLNTQNKVAHDVLMFDVTTIKFELDSFSTIHVVFYESLFILGAVEEFTGSGVKVIGGRVVVAKKRSIAIIIRSDDRESNILVIENVACVPYSPKNLISISQW